MLHRIQGRIFALQYRVGGKGEIMQGALPQPIYNNMKLRIAKLFKFWLRRTRCDPRYRIPQQFAIDTCLLQAFWGVEFIKKIKILIEIYGG
jgi:hypothetical protein